mmetsp:Transcript_9523/g.19037  ORF Transcript_9523/g.19037 Transcript_9523/m.19037 type:complete len:231 (-) Transcript_9523:1139-1831(-)
MLHGRAHAVLHLERALDGVGDEGVLGFLAVLQPLRDWPRVHVAGALLRRVEGVGRRLVHDMDEELEQERRRQGAAELDHPARRAGLERQILGQHGQRALERLVAHLLADQPLLRLGAVDAARCHAAVCEPRGGDRVARALLLERHVQACGDDCDVVVSPPGDLVALGELEGGGGRDGEREDQLVGPKGSLPVEALLEEVAHKHLPPLAVHLHQCHLGTARHENRVEVGDG